MESVLTCLTQEKPSAICLNLAPFNDDERFYEEELQVDRALFGRYVGKKHWKVGSSERIVYEKVAGLKRANTLQSIIYNFSSEGGLGGRNIPLYLVGASASQIGDLPPGCADNIKA
jgi:hypothetical protein